MKFAKISWMWYIYKCIWIYKKWKKNVLWDLSNLMKKRNWSVSCSKVQTLNSVIYQLNFEMQLFNFLSYKWIRSLFPPLCSESSKKKQKKIKLKQTSALSFNLDEDEGGEDSDDQPGIIQFLHSKFMLYKLWLT